METGKCGLAVSSGGKSCRGHIVHQEAQGQLALRTHGVGVGHLIQTVGIQESFIEES